MECSLFLASACGPTPDPAKGGIQVIRTNGAKCCHRLVTRVGGNQQHSVKSGRDYPNQSRESRCLSFFRSPGDLCRVLWASRMAWPTRQLAASKASNTPGASSSTAAILRASMLTAAIYATQSLRRFDMASFFLFRMSSKSPGGIGWARLRA